MVDAQDEIPNSCDRYVSKHEYGNCCKHGIGKSKQNETNEFDRKKCENKSLKQEVERLNEEQLYVIEYYINFVKKLKNKYEMQIADLEKKHQSLELQREMEKKMFDFVINEKNETICCLKSITNKLKQQL